MHVLSVDGFTIYPRKELWSLTEYTLIGWPLSSFLLELPAPASEVMEAAAQQKNPPKIGSLDVISKQISADLHNFHFRSLHGLDIQNL